MGNSEQPSRSNGHHADVDQPRRSVNPYVDALSGVDPPEIARFELHTDPYANMLPRLGSMTPGEGSEPVNPEEPERDRHPWLVVVSVALILILILPAMIVVFAKIFP